MNHINSINSIKNKIQNYIKLGHNYDDVMASFLKIKEILDNFKTTQNNSVKVFLQGSYKNSTNIQNSSDIDIVVFLNSCFRSNVNNPNDNILLNRNNINFTEKEKLDYYSTFSSSSYSQNQLKNELFKYLNQNDINIVQGNLTIKVPLKENGFVFDIIPAIEYRYYKNFQNNNTKYIQGNSIDSERIINFPKQTYENSIKKMKLTKGKYKNIVRFFKNYQKEIIPKNYRISSFALESIIYNVENKFFENFDINEFNCIKNILEEMISIVKNNFIFLKEPNEILPIQDLKKISKDNIIYLLSLMNKNLI